MNPKFEVKIVFKDPKKITVVPESERGLWQCGDEWSSKWSLCLSELSVFVDLSMSFSPYFETLKNSAFG